LGRGSCPVGPGAIAAWPFPAAWRAAHERFRLLEGMGLDPRAAAIRLRPVPAMPAAGCAIAPAGYACPGCRPAPAAAVRAAAMQDRFADAALSPGAPAHGRGPGCRGRIAALPPAAPARRPPVAARPDRLRLG